jgi:Zn ribbon nucleic-acid-binding protein
MLYLKSCPRCHGDLYLDRDSHGTFRQCLQCGFIQDLQAPKPVAVRAPAPQAAPMTRRSSGAKVAVA